MKCLVAPDAAGERLDRYVTRICSTVTRSQALRWITHGHVRVGGRVKKPAYVIRTGDEVEVIPPPPMATGVMPEALPLDILYEDRDLLVVNKPAGMVVHPGAGQSSGTLVNAVLAHCGDLTGIGDELRPGIVHRLDKGTSGVMVVAKTHAAHAALVRQFQGRTVEKIYTAVVIGRICAEGRIDAPIGRHPRDRKRMSTKSRRGREAVTAWKVVEYFDSQAAWLSVRLGTGRTHQIRVHFAALGHPLLGDATYGGRGAGQRLPQPWQDMLQVFSRPALHATRLGIIHPGTGERMAFEAPLPTDLLWLREQCRAFTGGEDGARGT